MQPKTNQKFSWVTVKEVMQLYPNRRKSWAYKELQTVKDCTGRQFVSWRDWAEFGPETGPIVSDTILSRT